jgi:hypothetical protein
MRQAWPALEHKFSIRRNDIALSDDGNLPGPTILRGHHGYPDNLLKKRPVDLLAIENGHLKVPPLKYGRTAWENVVEITPVDC